MRNAIAQYEVFTAKSGITLVTVRGAFVASLIARLLTVWTGEFCDYAFPGDGFIR
jgi:hypothetical protein